MAWPFYFFWQLVPPPQPPQGTGGHFSPLSFLNTHNDLKYMQTGTPQLDQGGGWGVCSGALSTPLVAVCVCLWPFFLRDWPFYGPFMALVSWPFYSRRLFCLPLTSSLGVF